MSMSRGPSQPSTFRDLLLLALFLGSNMRYCDTVTIYTATFSTKKMVFFERETKFFQQYVDLKKTGAFDFMHEVSASKVHAS